MITVGTVTQDSRMVLVILVIAIHSEALATNATKKLANAIVKPTQLEEIVLYV